MAMTVLNNSAAMMTLGELNKNITKVGKSLSKISTGQRIVYAGDNAADYGISETMRAKIRSLEQDVKNVQNGSSLLKTALGGIQNIVDELRELKELAIDAANDSNTDADRATMQKVLEQKRANIDNIATSTNFNSKSMLDGNYEKPHWEEKYFIQYDIPQTWTIDRSKQVIKYLVLDNGEDITGKSTKHGDVIKDTKASVIENMNTVTGLASAFTAMHNSVTFLDGTKSVETKDTALYSLNPNSIENGALVPNRNFIRSTGGAPMAIKMDFSGARIKTEDGGDGGAIFDKNGHADAFSISQLDGQGFSMLFSDSSRVVTIKFSTASSSTTFLASWNRFNSQGIDSGGDDANSGDIEYTVGISNFLNEEGVSSEDFTAYVFDSIRDCFDRKQYANVRNFRYNLQDDAGCTVWKDEPDGTDYINDTNIGSSSFILSQKHNLRMSKGEDGNYYITAYQRYSHSLSILDEGWLGKVVDGGNPSDTENWWKFEILSKDSDDTYTVAPVREKYEYKEFDGSPLWIQHGTKAGQHTNLFINDMRTSALMIDRADVSTKDRAVATIDYVDVAVEYALNEATNVGAYLARMEYTENNLTVENENTQSAESTMRDADMAKEMTAYTKNNVLSQAAQSMLAQANQNLSGVLSLLQ